MNKAAWLLILVYYGSLAIILMDKADSLLALYAEICIFIGVCITGSIIIQKIINAIHLYKQRRDQDPPIPIAKLVRG